MKTAGKLYTNKNLYVKIYLLVADKPLRLLPIVTAASCLIHNISITNIVRYSSLFKDVIVPISNELENQH